MSRPITSAVARIAALRSLVASGALASAMALSMGMSAAKASEASLPARTPATIAIAETEAALRDVAQSDLSALSPSEAASTVLLMAKSTLEGLDISFDIDPDTAAAMRLLDAKGVEQADAMVDAVHAFRAAHIPEFCLPEDCASAADDLERDRADTKAKVRLIASLIPLSGVVAEQASDAGWIQNEARGILERIGVEPGPVGAVKVDPVAMEKRFLDFKRDSAKEFARAVGAIGQDGADDPSETIEVAKGFLLGIHVAGRQSERVLVQALLRTRPAPEAAAEVAGILAAADRIDAMIARANRIAMDAGTTPQSKADDLRRLVADSGDPELVGAMEEGKDAYIVLEGGKP